MCDPFTVIMAASAGLKAGGSLIAGARSSKAARIQAELAGINADIAAKTGLNRENTLRDQVSRIEASQTASFAARGLDPSFGSPLQTAAFTAGQGETDARLIRADTLSAVASALGDKAAFDQKAADARFAGLFGAASAILGGAQDAWPGLQSGGGAPSLSGLPSWGGPR